MHNAASILGLVVGFGWKTHLFSVNVFLFFPHSFSFFAFEKSLIVKTRETNNLKDSEVCVLAKTI